MHESKNLKAHITKGRGSFITKLLEIMKVGFHFNSEISRHDWLDS